MKCTVCYRSLPVRLVEGGFYNTCKKNSIVTINKLNREEEEITITVSFRGETETLLDE